MHPKISHSFALTLIITFALFFGIEFYLFNKTNKIVEESSKSSRQIVSVERKNIPSETINTIKDINKNKETESDKSADKQAENDIMSDTKRISGSGCYEKNDDGTDDEMRLRKDFNLETANKLIKYSNKKKGISFDIPYNEKWGNKDCKVSPYFENDTDVIFGEPTAWGPDQFLMTVQEKRTAEEAVLAQKEYNKDIGGGAQPQVSKFGKLTVVTYELHEMIDEKVYEIIGKSHNYTFAYSLMDNKSTQKNDSQIRKVIESVEILD